MRWRTSPRFLGRSTTRAFTFSSVAIYVVIAGDGSDDVERSRRAEFVRFRRTVVAGDNRVADGLESTSFDKSSVSFDVRNRGIYEAKGNKCSKRELGLGVVHLVTLALDDARRLHERRR